MFKYTHTHQWHTIHYQQVNSAGTFNVIRLAAEQMSNGETYNKAGERGKVSVKPS